MRNQKLVASTAWLLVPSLCAVSLVTATATPEAWSVHRRAIVGGNLVENPASQYPYFVRLDYEGEQSCGGSLIHAEFILTAAHCAYEEDVGRLTAYIANGTTTNTNDVSSYIERQVKKVIPHFAYDDYLTLTNDMALLQIDPLLASDFGSDSGNVTRLPLVNLAQGKDWHTMLQDGDSVTVIGMGETEDEEWSPNLKEATLQIIDDPKCEEDWDYGLHFKSMICAASEQHPDRDDACRGDSGGPLLLLRDTPEDDIQVGVVSFGAEMCADAEIPSVFSDVAFLHSWIESTICKFATLDGSAPGDDATKRGCEITVDTRVGHVRIGPDEVCQDFGGAFFVNWWHQFQRCDWLRKYGRNAVFCTPDHEAWMQCPLTCHSCTYDDSDDQYSWDDQEVAYDDVSSGIAMQVSLIVLPTLLFCLGCCWVACHQLQRCRRKRKQTDLSTDLEDNSPALDHINNLNVDSAMGQAQAVDNGIVYTGTIVPEEAKAQFSGPNL